MRYLISFLTGGVAIGLVLMEPRWGHSRYLIAPPWVLALLYLGPLALISFLTGFAAAPRGALTALAAYVLGVVLWVTVQLRPSPPGTSDVWDYQQWGSFILTMLPTAIGSTIIGGIGSLVRMRVDRSRDRHQVLATEGRR